MKRTVAVRDRDGGGDVPEEVEEAGEGSEHKRAKGGDEDADNVLELSCEDFECVICCDLMVDPVVSKCGHDFCKFCLDQVCDAARKRYHQPSCPVCRTALTSRSSSSAELGVCIKLKELITRLFPRRSKQRRIEVDQEREREKAKAEAEAAQRATAAANMAQNNPFFPPGLGLDDDFGHHVLNLIQRSTSSLYGRAGHPVAGARADGASGAVAAAAVAAAAGGDGTAAAAAAADDSRRRSMARVQALMEAHRATRMSRSRSGAAAAPDAALAGAVASSAAAAAAAAAGAFPAAAGGGGGRGHNPRARSTADAAAEAADLQVMTDARARARRAMEHAEASFEAAMRRAQENQQALQDGTAAGIRQARQQPMPRVVQREGPRPWLRPSGIPVTWMPAAAAPAPAATADGAAAAAAPGDSPAAAVPGGEEQVHADAAAAADAAPAADMDIVHDISADIAGMLAETQQLLQQRGTAGRAAGHQVHGDRHSRPPWLRHRQQEGAAAAAAATAGRGNAAAGADAAGVPADAGVSAEADAALAAAMPRAAALPAALTSAAAAHGAARTDAAARRHRRFGRIGVPSEAFDPAEALAAAAAPAATAAGAATDAAALPVWLATAEAAPAPTPAAGAAARRRLPARSLDDLSEAFGFSGAASDPELDMDLQQLYNVSAVAAAHAMPLPVAPAWLPDAAVGEGHNPGSVAAVGAAPAEGALPVAGRAPAAAAAAEAGPRLCRLVPSARWSEARHRDMALRTAEGVNGFPPVRFMLPRHGPPASAAASGLRREAAAEAWISVSTARLPAAEETALTAAAAAAAEALEKAEASPAAPGAARVIPPPAAAAEGVAAPAADLLLERAAAGVAAAAAMRGRASPGSAAAQLPLFHEPSLPSQDPTDSDSLDDEADSGAVLRGARGAARRADRMHPYRFHLEDSRQRQREGRLHPLAMATLDLQRPAAVAAAGEPGGMAGGERAAGAAERARARRAGIVADEQRDAVVEQLRMHEARAAAAGASAAPAAAAVNPAPEQQQQQGGLRPEGEDGEDVQRLTAAVAAVAAARPRITIRRRSGDAPSQPRAGVTVEGQQREAAPDLGRIAARNHQPGWAAAAVAAATAATAAAAGAAGPGGVGQVRAAPLLGQPVGLGAADGVRRVRLRPWDRLAVDGPDRGEEGVGRPAAAAAAAAAPAAPASPTAVPAAAAAAMLGRPRALAGYGVWRERLAAAAAGPPAPDAAPARPPAAATAAGPPAAVAAAGGEAVAVGQPAAHPPEAPAAAADSSDEATEHITPPWGDEPMRPMRYHGDDITRDEHRSHRAVARAAAAAAGRPGEADMPAWMAAPRMASRWDAALRGAPPPPPQPRHLAGAISNSQRMRNALGRPWRRGSDSQGAGVRAAGPAAAAAEAGAAVAGRRVQQRPAARRPAREDVEMEVIVISSDSD